MTDPTPGGAARVELRERHRFGDGDTPIAAISLSPDGRVLATSHAVHPGSPTGSHVRLWQMPEGREIGRLVPDAKAGGPLAFSADGKLLASGSNFGGKEAKVWEVDGLRLVCALPHPDYVKSVAFSMDGRWLATAAGAARVWDTRSWNEVRELEGLKDYVTSLAFSPDSEYLAAGAFNRDRRVVIWKCGSWTVGRSFAEHEEGAMRAAFSPNGRWLAAGTNYQELKLWEVATGKEAWSRRGHASGIHALAFSPDGRWLASTSNETIKLWSVENGAEVFSQAGHQQHVWGVAFTPEGECLVSAGWDGRIRVWDVFQPS